MKRAASRDSRAWSRSAARPGRGAWILLAVLTAGGGALRLIDLGSVGVDPFYDAAVRSMGLSWHNFFFGAFEPGGSVSIDKPPLDLWLQVASVKLLGFDSTALKLPEALAGTLAVPLLFAAVRRPFGVPAGLGAALALAVLPVEVITSRSDTMDALMMMLVVLALALLVRACETGDTRWLLAGAVALGLAFDVKLFESLVALPGLAAMVLLGFRRPRAPATAPRARLAAFAAAGAVYVVVAFCWLTATLLFPAHDRPFAIGSTDGSAWNAAFVFNGTDRILGKAVEAQQPSGHRERGAKVRNSEHVSIPVPSPTRLLTSIGPLPFKRLGLQALLALLLGLPAVALALRGPPLRRAVGVGLGLWLLTGLVLFSHMSRLHPRYVEGFTPAVAALLGIGVAWLAGFAGRGRIVVLVALLAAALAVPLQASIQAIKDRISDAGNVGAASDREIEPLSVYLRAHQGGARYEVAADSATRVASLVVEDARPVLVLTTYNARTLTSIAQLKRSIARGEVRYALLSSQCGVHTPRTVASCSPPALWVRAHGIDVSHEAGLARAKVLWRLPRAAR